MAWFAADEDLRHVDAASHPPSIRHNAFVDLHTYLALDDAARETHLETLTDDALIALGVTLFNAREFWHAHEAWEQVWLEAPNPMRAFYQGLIQVAAAFVHVQRNEYPGAVRLLENGIAKLELYPQGSA